MSLSETIQSLINTRLTEHQGATRVTGDEGEIHLESVESLSKGLLNLEKAKQLQAKNRLFRPLRSTMTDPEASTGPCCGERTYG